METRFLINTENSPSLDSVLGGGGGGGERDHVEESTILRSSVNIIILCHTIKIIFQDKEGDTALHCAVYGNWHMAVRPLVFAGANPGLENSRQLSPIHLACAIGFTAYIFIVCIPCLSNYYVSLFPHSQSCRSYVETQSQLDSLEEQRRVHSSPSRCLEQPL